jgi:hypothetical protein
MALKKYSPDTVIGGKTLREWGDSWETLPGGFQPKRPHLRTVVGLVRALLDGETVYILCASEWAKGGIEKGLQRIRGKAQTGNDKYGAQQLRAHMERLELEILAIGDDEQASKTAKLLKPAMVRILDPQWNRPHRRRMESMRAARGK